MNNLQEKWLKKFGAEFVFNKHCNHLIRDGDDYKCKIKMDMGFCSNKCAYATNMKLTNKTDGYGKVKGIKE